MLLARVIICGLILTGGFSVHAWDSHHLVTQASLEPLKSLQSEVVLVSSQEELLSDLGYNSLREFQEKLVINKNYLFEFHLEEKPEEAISLVRVLAYYSDEPDWGMDQELFSPDQYPQLWKDEYAYMGGKTGTPSQAFRHMYWPKFDPEHPVRTFKLPTRAAMGEAPNRAKIFMTLAEKSFQAGHPYWGVRFMANALHYLQDVANPYHASQTPTKKFILELFNIEKENAFKSFTQKMTQVIAYYHFSFEAYMAHLLGTKQGGLHRVLSAKLRGPTYRHDMKSTIENMASFSIRYAPLLGKNSIHFFPPIEEDLLSFSPSEALNPEWWAKVNYHQQKNPRSYRELLRGTRVVFRRLGVLTRNIVEKELFPYVPWLQ